MKQFNKFFGTKKDAQGFSLLEVTVAVGILGIIVWATTGLIISLMNENKALSEKLESIELEQSLNRLTTESNVCSCMFDSPAWSPGVSEIELNHLKKGCVAESLLSVGEPVNSGSKLKTESIKIKNISVIGSGNLMGDLEIKLSGGARSIKPLLISGLSFSPDNIALPQKISTCLGVAGAQQLCVGMGGTWDGHCSLPPSTGAEPLGIAETCVALGGVFTDPTGPCVFNSSKSDTKTRTEPGTLVAHCESYKIGSTPGGKWPSYCFDESSWCKGSGASLPSTCPSGSVLSNYYKKQRDTCPQGSYIIKFDCISN